MNIKYKTIRSIESETNPKPWYVVDVEDDEIVIKEDKDGGRDSDLKKSSTLIPEVSGSGDVTYVVTEGGEFISWDPRTTEDVPQVRAHLGWYDSETDTLTLLEFEGE